eukprot:TRINITY_DN20688_c0_g1_i2.p1 TRINITY_DN20688_c0_g1~~TRINITY_DN20688_c0_g1_i2.p1  ORF type:complete len:290 (+),score=52.07 TRINITY_DN20688_c0_g1_i2:23-871(+)
MCIRVTGFFHIFFFQAEDGIRDRSPSRGLGDVYKRQGKYTLQGRKIVFNLSKSNRKPGDAPPSIDVQCWFCLGNPQVNKSLIVKLFKEVYLAMDKGPITKGHILIIPIEHFPCSPMVPLAVYDEMQVVKRHINRAYMQSMRRLVIYFERYIRMTSSISHMHIQAIPYDASRAEIVVKAFDKYARDSQMPFVKLKEGESLLDVVKEGQFFFYFEIHETETQAVKYLYIIQEKYAMSFSKEFGRQVVCELLDAKDKLNWKNATLEEAQEKQWVSEIRSIFSSNH